MIIKTLTIFFLLFTSSFGRFVAQPSLKEEKFATLKIPSISLEEELYSKEDSRNDLDQNIIFLPTSSAPYEEQGNVILAGHSGYFGVAPFKRLYQVKKGDMIFLTYEGNEYRYQVTARYTVLKTGKVSLQRDPLKKTITLITCYDNKRQLVLIGEQKK